MNTIEGYLELIEKELNNSKIVRFTNKVAVDKDHIFDILMELRTNMPVEIYEAKKIIEDHDNIIDDANLKREQIIKEADARANTLIKDHEIYKKAEKEGDEYLKNAKKITEEWSLQSVEYVDKILDEAGAALTDLVVQMEKSQKETIDFYGKLYNTIHKNREELRR